MNEYRLKKTAPKILTEKARNEILKRQKLALLYKAKEKIEDFQNEVFEIIDNNGLKNEEDKIKLETALKILEYIVPKKKSSEVTITSRKLEDIIEEIEEAQILPDKQDNKTDKNLDNITEQTASKGK